MPRTVLPGRPYPQGATWDGTGVNFSIYSEGATAVDLCLFESLNTAECQTIPIRESTGHVWHGYVPALWPGQLYGYRIHGPYEPEKGLRYNPAKLLIDPYAKAVAGQVDWKAPVFGYPLGDGDADLKLDERDDAAAVPKGVVITSHFDWENDRPPLTPLHETVIYETHVKGITARHPGVPEEIRGTYAGLAHPVVIDHLKHLGVTAVELMPVHAFLDDAILLDRGLRNYWGYNTINFFSPEARYSAAGDLGGQLGEFKSMVKALHRANIEVILDVVYNHTAEGNQLGPTLSFRGIDNAAYYRLVSDNPRYYMDFTGTGNTINVRHPQVLKLVMDSLRYWVLEMHVDGFRFDLAAALARELHEVDRLSAFFDIINQDPVTSQVKLIAEPWDVGEGGYQVGKFPTLWAEWNGPTAMSCAGIGRAMMGRSPSWGTASRAAAISTSAIAATPPPALISSRRTTASHFRTWSATTTSTTKPTGKRIATAPMTIIPGTTAPRAPPATPASSSCASARNGTSSRRCCFPRACR